MTVPDSVLLTRDAWHRLAEQVLSAARHAATGRIWLRDGIDRVPDPQTWLDHCPLPLHRPERHRRGNLAGPNPIQ